jgi:hypothetical protein
MTVVTGPVLSGEPILLQNTRGVTVPVCLSHIKAEHSHTHTRATWLYHDEHKNKRCVCACVCRERSVCVLICGSVKIDVHTYIYLCIHMHKHTHTHTHTRVCSVVVAFNKSVFSGSVEPLIDINEVDGQWGFDDMDLQLER